MNAQLKIIEEQLINAGVPAEQASAILEVIVVTQQNLATKDDIAGVQGDIVILKEQVSDLKDEIKDQKERNDEKIESTVKLAKNEILLELVNLKTSVILWLLGTQFIFVSLVIGALGVFFKMLQ